MNTKIENHSIYMYSLVISNIIYLYYKIQNNVFWFCLRLSLIYNYFSFSCLSVIIHGIQFNIPKKQWDIHKKLASNIFKLKCLTHNFLYY